jgi:hypothetical protein
LRLWPLICNILVDTNTVSLGALLLFYVSELQTSTSTRLKYEKIFHRFYLFQISSWFEGISLEILVKRDVTLLEISQHTYIHTYIHIHNVLLRYSLRNPVSTTRRHASQRSASVCKRLTVRLKLG